MSDNSFGGDRDPYQWAGKMAVDGGKIPLKHWRGNVTVMTTTEARPAHTSEDDFANAQMRPETKGTGKGK